MALFSFFMIKLSRYYTVLNINSLYIEEPIRYILFSLRDDMNTAFQNHAGYVIYFFIPLKSQFVLFGNVRDLQASEIAPNNNTTAFNQTLYNSLYEVGSFISSLIRR